MIPCQVCGNQNPIGTRYCRRCGEKIQVDQRQLFEAVQEDQDAKASLRWIERGRSLLVMGLFLLVCALVVSQALVPAMPVAEVPPVAAGALLPGNLPRVEVRPEAKAATMPEAKPAVVPAAKAEAKPVAVPAPAAAPPAKPAAQPAPKPAAVQTFDPQQLTAPVAPAKR